MLWKTVKNFMAIFDAVRTAIIIIDPVLHKIVEVNFLACEISGYTKEEMIGKDCFQIMCPAEKGRCPITDLGQRIDNSERILIGADGREIPILKTATTINLNNNDYLVESFVEVTDLKEAEFKILSTLMEKEMLLRELRHRVKNNLMVVTSILQIQERHTPDDFSRNILKQIQNRIFSMAIIHERLSQENNLMNIDFREYVQKLIEQLTRSFFINLEDIVISIDIKNEKLNVDTAIPCGLIVTELISNALNHAFPREGKGEVRIKLQRLKDRNYILTVQDNGVGLPEDVDLEKPSSMGLLIVTGLVEQLSGTLKINRSKGTTFQITFTEYNECGIELQYSPLSYT